MRKKRFAVVGVGHRCRMFLHWLLNTRHGADYFRRWHRNKRNSGGLLVHKATHHFDLVNWWLGTVPGELAPEGTHTRIFPHFQAAYEVELWTGSGGHGGGDPILLDDLFGKAPPPDTYQRAADYRAGAWSLLTGVAGNRSMERGAPVRIDERGHGLEEPRYPPMPSADEPVDAASMIRWLEAHHQRRANRPT